MSRTLCVVVVAALTFACLGVRQCVWHCTDAPGEGLSVEDKVRLNVQALRDDKSVITRAGAAKVLGDIGPDAAEGTPALADALLHDKHSMVRTHAAKALGKIRNGDEEGVHALDEALWTDKSTEVRKNAIWALGEIGDRSDDTIKGLSAALRNKDPEISVCAARAMSKIGSSSSTVIYYLCEALLHASSPRVRQEVARTLGDLGPGARDATTTLAKALEDGDAEVRLSAAEALGKIGREALEAASALSKATRDADTRVRAQAKESLKEMARSRR